MKIGLVSDYSDCDVETNITTILKYLNEYHHLDLLLFSEGFLQGFNSLTWVYEKDIQIALSKDDKRLSPIKKVCQENNIAVGFGYYEKVGPLLYCSYMIIDQNGTIINNYRRLSDGWKYLTKVTPNYRNGTKLLPFSLNGYRLLTVLCGDLWDDQIKEKVINVIAEENINLLLWPNHLDYPREQFQNELPEYQHRSQGIKIPTLLVNDHSEFSHGGAVVFKDGNILNYLEVGKKAVLEFNLT